MQHVVDMLPFAMYHRRPLYVHTQFVKVGMVVQNLHVGIISSNDKGKLAEQLELFS